MPSFIVAPININAISSDAVVNFGDTLVINPKSTSKGYNGSGGGNNGNFLQTFTGASNTVVIDSDAIDSSNAANA